MLFLYLTVDLRHLFHVQLARQHHHVGELCVELQCLDVGDVQLRGEVYLHSLLAAIGHHRHVGSDDSRYLRLLGRIDDLAHRGQVLTVNDGVDRQVGLDVVFTAGGGNLMEVVNGEMVGGVGAHVQLSDAEINDVGTSLDGRCQRVARPHGSHHFEVFQRVHGRKGTK